MNIERHERNVNYQSNPRITKKDAYPLMYVKPHFVVPDGDGWAPAPSSCVWNDGKNPLSSTIRVRGSRKQRAARAYIPKESIKIVKKKEPVHPIVGITILQGGSAADIEVATVKGVLCDRLKELLG